MEKCPLCGGFLSDDMIRARDFLTDVKGVFDYKRCAKCGSYIQSPLPSQDFLNRCYESQDLGYFKPLDKESLFSSYKSTEGSGLRRLIYDFLPVLKTIKLIPICPAPARILEIGSSYGARLFNLKQMGYFVTGLELNADMARFAREKLGLDIKEGIAEDVTFQENSFDIIIASMMLEHSLNPRDVILKVSRWLRPGGELLISLPCSDGFEFRMFKECCYIVHPPYHISLPSLSGIKSLVSPFFDIEDLGFQFFHRDLVSSASFAYSINPALRYRIIIAFEKVTVLKKMIRAILLCLTLAGLRTSRVSLRCIKR